jgi:hypothetical protein
MLMLAEVQKMAFLSFKFKIANQYKITNTKSERFKDTAKD